MVELILEVLFGASQLVILFRLFYHTNVSLKKKQSVTPIIYWVLTIFSSILLGIYGFYASSIVIPLTALVSVGFSVFHIWIEIKRNYAETIGDDLTEAFFPER